MGSGTDSNSRPKPMSMQIFGKQVIQIRRGNQLFIHPEARKNAVWDSGTLVPGISSYKSLRECLGRTLVVGKVIALKNNIVLQ